ncbi:hypothetical protein [Methylobacterium durans]|nr:hypothetical protein [Methylobacterium durans]
MAKVGDLRSIGHVRDRDPLISFAHTSFSLALACMLTLLAQPFLS